MLDLARPEEVREAGLERVDCGVCGARESTPLFEAEDFIYGNAGRWPVARCLGCGVVFMNPRIPPHEIGAYYPKTYYTNTAVARKESRFKEGIRRELLRRYFGYPLERGDATARLVVGVLGPWIHRRGQIRKNIRYVAGGSVLDVGCGNGEQLDAYRRLGWATYGAEVGPESAALAIAAGHRVVQAELVAAGLPGESFDAITFWDALEHVHNPAETMREALRLLRPGRRAYVYVPNYGSIYGRLFGARWFMFTAPLHYYHFTRHTLRALFERAGFVDVHVATTDGGAGLRPTLGAIFQSQRAITRVLRLPPVTGALRVLDQFLPWGHLVAVGMKKEGESASTVGREYRG